MEEIAAMNDELTIIQNQLQNYFKAIDRSAAVIEFDLNGIILTANENFLKIIDYQIEEIKGKHHRIFVFPDESVSSAYKELWIKLAKEEYIAGVFRRRDKNGKTIWIHGSYNPILDAKGVSYKVVKYVFDITREKEQELKLQELLEEKTQREEEVRQQMEEIVAINDKLSEVQAELQSQLNAINRSVSVVEFDLSGRILNANENFLKMVGYAKEEILDKHHRIFMFPEDAETEAYQKFWQTLGAGNYVSDVFRRKAKDGKERWIMGSYNPLYDKNGKVYKFAKFVYDVTREKRQEYELQRALKEVEESIFYAQRIQKAIIPEPSLLNEALPYNYQSAVFFKPRNIVSGDFYWIGNWKRRRVLAVGDGTGHGAPGSMMSLIGISAIAKLVERGITDPSILLEEADEEVKKVLGQLQNNIQDTVEMIICCLDPEADTLIFASAMRPLYLWDGQTIQTLLGSRFPVGGTLYEHKRFINQTLTLKPNDCLYLTSDGLNDQFGGPGSKPKRMGRKMFLKALADISQSPLNQRVQQLSRIFQEWKRNEEQTDDIICLILEYKGRDNIQSAAGLTAPLFEND
jgi:PAS domain S-box-containing protein